MTAVSFTTKLKQLTTHETLYCEHHAPEHTSTHMVR